MSATAAFWLFLFGLLSVLWINRGVWAVALYMLTFFAAPSLWWWGDQIPDLRYALVAGLVLLAAVLMHASKFREIAGRRFTRAHWAGLAMVVNATFVHFTFATRPNISLDPYIELMKFVLLVFLLWGVIQDRRDYRLALMAIALGAGYIGYEVTINERGEISGGRLEGVGAPGAYSANSLADVMLITLPLTGSLLVNSRAWQKVAVALSAPLALNVLLLCNSRGAFLGLAAAGLSFPLIARGGTRRRAIKTLALGSIALYLMLGDPRIFERFVTTFSGSEERDSSAASRLEFWKAGYAMLQDYPLGAGGNAFKYVHGGHYLRMVTEIDEERSLHNGYLTEATSWGVQGLTLQLVMILTALMAAYRTSERCRLEGRFEDGLIGICVVVSCIAFLIHCFFGSFLGNEWGYWVVALLLRYSEIYATAEPAALASPSGPLPAATAA